MRSCWVSSDWTTGFVSDELEDALIAEHITATIHTNSVRLHKHTQLHSFSSILIQNILIMKQQQKTIITKYVKLLIDDRQTQSKIKPTRSDIHKVIVKKPMVLMTHGNTVN